MRPCKFITSTTLPITDFTVVESINAAKLRGATRLAPGDKMNVTKRAAAQKGDPSLASLAFHTPCVILLAIRNADEFVAVVANVMHNYAVIQRAANDTKAEVIAEAAAKKEVLTKSFLELKFSSGWVKGFLKRFRLSRQRITSALKANRPLPEEVQRTMADIQKRITALGLELRDIL